jgi:hypothetical protein
MLFLFKHTVVVPLCNRKHLFQLIFLLENILHFSLSLLQLLTDYLQIRRLFCDDRLEILDHLQALALDLLLLGCLGARNFAPLI